MSASTPDASHWRRCLATIWKDTIHTAPDRVEVLAEIREAAHQLGMAVFVIDGSGLRTMEDVDQALRQELLIPYGFYGWDAQLSLMADLEWLGNDVGYVLVIEHADQWRRNWPEGFQTFVEVTTSLSDRWQTGAQPFHIVYLCDEETARRVEEIVDSEMHRGPWDFEVAVTHHGTADAGATSGSNPWRPRLRVIYRDTLHLAPERDETASLIRAAARELGMLGFFLDGSSFSTEEDVDRALAEEVMPPFPFRGWNAQESILTNLEWFDNDIGYVLTVRGCDEWHVRWPEGFKTFVQVVTGASRQWQNLTHAFHAVFLGGLEIASVVEQTVQEELELRPREFDVRVSRYED